MTYQEYMAWSPHLVKRAERTLQHPPRERGHAKGVLAEVEMAIDLIEKVEATKEERSTLRAKGPALAALRERLNTLIYYPGG